MIIVLKLQFWFGGTGYYRVNYDLHNWKLLTNQLKTNHSVIDVINRAHLIDDCFTIAATSNSSRSSGDESSSQNVDYGTAFRLIEYLTNEDDYIPWSTALKVLNDIGRMFCGTPDHGRFKVFLKYGCVIPSRFFCNC